MNNRKYHLQLGEASAFTKRTREAKKGIGQRYIKGDTKNCFIFDNWFFLNKLREAVMYVGTDFIGMVKTNTKLLFKEIIEKLTKDCTGGSYLMLRKNLLYPGSDR